MTEKAQVFGAATQTKINVKFLKGGSLTAFKNWSANNAGVQAIFFDTRDKRIYVGNGAGEPECLDSELKISHSMDVHGVTSTILSFTKKETGETMQIPDAIAGTLSDDGKEVDLSTGKSGLMSQIDKLTLDGLAQSLGASIEYEWRATNEGQTIICKCTESEDGVKTFTYGDNDEPLPSTATAPVPYAKFKLTAADMAKNMLFDGGDAPDDLKTLTTHGNLAKNTTIAQLEGMSYSELFKEILFETAIPKQKSAMSTSISFKNYGTTIDVGANYPTVENFSSTFSPEIYYWQSQNDTSITGGDTALNVGGTAKYYYSTSSTGTASDILMNGADSAYVASEHKVKEGVNGYFYAKIPYTKGSNAVDSLGSDKDKSGSVYKEAYENAEGVKTKVLSFTGAWKMYHNANKIGSASDIWKVKNVNPGAYVGASEKTDGNFVTGDSKTYYMQWCGGTLADQPCYIYIPNSYKISSILMANGTIENKFDIACDYEENPTLVTFSNTYQEGTFKRYEIGKNGSAILSLEIKVVKA